MLFYICSHHGLVQCHGNEFCFVYYAVYNDFPTCLFLHKFLNFDIIIDSQVLVRNNIQISCVLYLVSLKVPSDKAIV